MDVRIVTVGPFAENCYIVRKDGANEAVVIDPGEEPERILGLIEELSLTVKAILITHTHFDHIGAVSPVAKATGAPVICPELETFILADIMRFVPWPDIGPFESYEADLTVKGGERLTYAGIDFDVHYTPGHSVGHVSYYIPEAEFLFSGDVLFEGSIGRTDLPGGDLGTLLDSIGRLVETLPADTRVHPGHMGITTLKQERATNPYLRKLPLQS